MIANNFEEFVSKVTNAAANAWNNADDSVRKQLLMPAVEKIMESNPELLSTQKQIDEFMETFFEFIVLSAIKEDQDLFKEMAHHVYNELNKTSEVELCNLRA